MIAHRPISDPMPKARLTQLIRFGSASLGTSMLAAAATAVRSSESRRLVLFEGADRDRIQRRALQVDEGAACGALIEHPGGRGGGAVHPGTHRHGGKHRGEVGIEARRPVPTTTPSGTP